MLLIMAVRHCPARGRCAEAAGADGWGLHPQELPVRHSRTRWSGLARCICNCGVDAHSGIALEWLALTDERAPPMGAAKEALGASVSSVEQL